MVFDLELAVLPAFEHEIRAHGSGLAFCNRSPNMATCLIFDGADLERKTAIKRPACDVTEAGEEEVTRKEEQ